MEAGYNRYDVRSCSDYVPFLLLPLPMLDAAAFAIKKLRALWRLMAAAGHRRTLVYLDSRDSLRRTRASLRALVGPWRAAAPLPHGAHQRKVLEPDSLCVYLRRTNPARVRIVKFSSLLALTEHLEPP